MPCRAADRTSSLGVFWASTSYEVHLLEPVAQSRDHAVLLIRDLAERIVQGHLQAHAADGGRVGGITAVGTDRDIGRGYRDTKGDGEAPDIAHQPSRRAGSGGNGNLVAAEGIGLLAQWKGHLPGGRSERPRGGRCRIAAIGDDGPGRRPAIDADIGGHQCQGIAGAVPSDRCGGNDGEIRRRSGIDGAGGQATEHADHTNFLHHLAEDKARILLHAGGLVLADIGTLGRDEYLGNSQDDDQSQGDGDHQLDQAEASAMTDHGPATGSTATRLLSVKLGLAVSWAILAARWSLQLILIVTALPFTTMLPSPLTPAKLLMLVLKS